MNDGGEFCVTCGAPIPLEDQAATRLTAPGGTESVWRPAAHAEQFRSAAGDVGPVENLGITDPIRSRRRESRTLPPPVPMDELARKMAELRAYLHRPLKLYRPPRND